MEQIQYLKWANMFRLRLVFFLRVCGHQVEGVLADTKNQLTSEILRRVEMENQVQTLKEQLELQRNISEQVKHSGIPLNWQSWP